MKVQGWTNEDTKMKGDDQTVEKELVFSQASPNKMYY